MKRNIRRYTPEERARHIQELENFLPLYETRGACLREYSKSSGIPESTLDGWLRVRQPVVQPAQEALPQEETTLTPDFFNYLAHRLVDAENRVKALERESSTLSALLDRYQKQKLDTEVAGYYADYMRNR